MEKETILAVVQIAAPVILTAIGFFVRSFFRSLDKDLKAVSNGIAKFEGQLLAMSHDLRNNTIETVKTSAEVRALWRIQDKAHQRASDCNGST